MTHYDSYDLLYRLRLSVLGEGYGVHYNARNIWGKEGFLNFFQMTS
jgi:hypothetical protein